MKSSRLLAVLLAFFSLSAHAEIYKYVDESGHVTYTNIPKKGAKRLALDPVAQGSAGRNRAAAASSSPAAFPKVDGETQRRRDDLRHKILDDEMATEKKLLDESRKVLAEGEATRLGDERNNYQKYLDRVQKLKSEVELHEKNIAALQKELSNLK